jgi:hypothetical protein
VPHHERLFLAQFDPKGNEAKCKSRYRAKAARYESAAEEHEKQSRVNWVPHETVWSLRYQFMLLLQCYIAAPITPQNGASPNSDKKPDDAERTG